MTCPICGHELLEFRVPPGLLEHAPDGKFAAICPRCLELEPANTAPDEADFSVIVETFPEGDAGAATALGVGLAVESLALNRRAIAECMNAASDLGVDPWLVLERLAVAGSVQPDADLARIRRQLEQLL